MKIRLLTATLALLVAGGANAASIYELSSVAYQNTFAGLAISNCPSCVGGAGPVSKAFVDDFGGTTLTNVAWGLSGFGNNYLYSFASGTTSVGTGETLSTTGWSCTQTMGNVCSASSIQSGLGWPTHFSGLGGDGTTVCALCQVNVIQGASTLTVQIQKALAEGSGNFQRYTLNYTLVPVPAAVWMFASALGLVGFLRRRAAV